LTLCGYEWLDHIGKGIPQRPHSKTAAAPQTQSSFKGTPDEGVSSTSPSAGGTAGFETRGDVANAAAVDDLIDGRDIMDGSAVGNAGLSALRAVGGVRMNLDTGVTLRPCEGAAASGSPGKGLALAPAPVFDPMGGRCSGRRGRKCSGPSTLGVVVAAVSAAMMGSIENLSSTQRHDLQ
jgi:hypothetical protein